MVFGQSPTPPMLQTNPPLPAMVWTEVMLSRAASPVAGELLHPWAPPCT